MMHPNQALTNPRSLPLGQPKSAGGEFRGAHPSRVQAEASRLGELQAWDRLRTSEAEALNVIWGRKVRVGETPTPARETRALPGIPHPRRHK